MMQKLDHEHHVVCLIVTQGTRAEVMEELRYILKDLGSASMTSIMKNRTACGGSFQGGEETRSAYCIHAAKNHVTLEQMNSLEALLYFYSDPACNYSDLEGLLDGSGR